MTSAANFVQTLIHSRKNGLETFATSRKFSAFHADTVSQSQTPHSKAYASSGTGSSQ